MKQITFKKLALIICLFCAAMIFLTASAFAQDTIRVEKVLVKNQLIYAKTGKVMRTWWRKTKVKKGYIIKRDDGMFVINGKVMIPNDFSYTPEKQYAKSEMKNQK